MLLAHRGWTYADLAQATGYATQTIRNVASGNWRGLAPRRKIEAIFGQVIWPPIKRPAPVPAAPTPTETAPIHTS